MAAQITETVRACQYRFGNPMKILLTLNCPMKTCDEIRKDNIDRLIDEAGGINFLAARYGCTPAYIKAMTARYKDSATGKEKGVGDASARKLEEVMGKERGWMDHSHDLQVAEPTAFYGDSAISQVVSMMQATDATGRAMALGAVKAALSDHAPGSKQTAA